MDVISFITKLVVEHPTVAPLIIVTFFWWRENGERKELQKINFELQGKLLDALHDAKTIMSQGNALLQFLMNSNGRRR